MAKQLVKDATTEDEKQSLGFFMNKIGELTFKSIPDCRKVEELLFKRLTHKHPIIRVKVLRIIKYLCENGRDTFRADLHREHEPIRANLHFSGPKHPLYGDRQYTAVRAAAKDALDAVFAAPTQHAESLRTRIQGITSQHISSDSVRSPSNGAHAGQPSPPRGRPQEPPRGAASPGGFSSTGVYRGPTSSAPGRRPMPGIGNAAPPKQGYFEKLKGRIDHATAAAVRRADGSSAPPAGYGPPQTGGSRAKASSSREQPRERGKVGGSAWGGATQRYVPVSERTKRQPASTAAAAAAGPAAGSYEADEGSSGFSHGSASPHVPAVAATAAPEADILGGAFDGGNDAGGLVDVFSSMTMGAPAAAATSSSSAVAAASSSAPATFDPLGLDFSSPSVPSTAPAPAPAAAGGGLGGDAMLTDILTSAIPAGSMSGSQFLESVKMRQNAPPAANAYGFPVAAAASSAPAAADTAGFGFMSSSPSPAVQAPPAQTQAASGFGFMSAAPAAATAAAPAATFGFATAPAAAQSMPAAQQQHQHQQQQSMVFSVRSSTAATGFQQPSRVGGAAAGGMTDHFAHVGIGASSNTPQTVAQPLPKADDPFSFVMDSFGKK